MINNLQSGQTKKVRPSGLSRPLVLCFLLMMGFYCPQAQEIDYTQYFLNVPGTDPGFTGFEDFLDTRMAFRQGWNDFGVVNNYSYLSAYGSLNNARRTALRSNALRTSNPLAYQQMESGRKLRRKHGIGGMVTNRNLGPYRSISVSTNYAYHLPLSERLNLSFGTKIAYGNQRIDFNGYTVRDEVNDLFYQQLMRTSQGNESSVLVDFGYVLYSKVFYLSVASNNLIKTDISGVNLLEDNARRRYTLQSAVTRVPLGKDLAFSPGFRILYTPSQHLLWSFNGRVRYKELLYVGSGFSSQGSKLSLLFGFNLKDKMSINYAYDKYLSELNNFNVSVHEFVFGFTLFNRYASRAKLW